MSEHRTSRWPVIALAAVIVVYTGSLSPVFIATALSARLGGMTRGAIALSGCLLLGIGALLNNRVRLRAAVLLGVIPYLYLFVILLRGETTDGAFVYLYYFAPFLFAGLLWALLRRVTDRQFFWTIAAVGSLIAVRAILVFIFPDRLGPAREFAAGTDAFFAFDYVGALPRVFFPGQGLLFAGMAIAWHEIMYGRGRSQLAAIPFLLLELAGLLVAMTRGVTILTVLMFALLVVWTLLDSRARGRRRLNVLAGGIVLLVAALGAVALLSDSKSLLDLESSDRLSLNEHNLVWREDQMHDAFSMMKTDTDWVFGVGPNRFVPGAASENNQLHLSYHSVVWTFGFVGLGVLVAVLLTGILAPLFVRERREYWRPMWMTILFIAAVGTYTPTFGTVDWNLALMLATAYLWLPGAARAASDPDARELVASVPSRAFAATWRGPSRGAGGTVVAPSGRPLRWSDGIHQRKSGAARRPEQ